MYGFRIATRFSVTSSSDYVVALIDQRPIFVAYYISIFFLIWRD